MNTHSKTQVVTRYGTQPANAEQPLQDVGIAPPTPPEPFDTDSVRDGEVHAAALG